MPYKTIQSPAALFVRHKDVSVYHTYENDDVSDALKEYYYVLDEDHEIDDSFDVRDLKAWQPVPPVPPVSNQSPERNYTEHQLQHIKQILIAAIDSGELSPYQNRQQAQAASSMDYKKELQELIQICIPIITEAVEKWSNGEDCYQLAHDHIEALTKKLQAP